MSRKAAVAKSDRLGDALAACFDAFSRELATCLKAQIQATVPAAPSTKPPDFLGEGEVSKRLSISVRTLQSWRARGGGPEFVHAGRRVLYARSAVDDFLRGRAQ